MFAKYLFLLVSITSVQYQAAYPSSSPFFRKDYRYDPDSQAFYKQHKMARAWSLAVSQCAAEGAELATPATADDAAALLAHMENGTSYVYLGLHDLFKEGYFITLNGTSIEDMYANWMNYQPDNYAGAQNCVVLKSDGLYDDSSCKSARKFICKKDLSTLTWNTPCDTYDKEYVYSSKADRCYKMHTKAKSWHDAYQTCSSEEAHLGIVNSADEAQIYVDIMNLYPADNLKGSFNKELIHIGFNDLIIPGDFKTIDGKFLSDSGYEEWSPGQPDNYGNAQHCGSMLRNGKLNDIECSVKAMFMCERKLKHVGPLEMKFGNAV